MEIVLEHIKVYGLRIIGVLVFLFVASMVAKWLGALVTKQLQKREFDNTLSLFFGKVTKVTILGLSIIAALGAFGVETTSFAAVLAGASLAIGLAFQGTLSNFAAGVMLLVFRPFKVGQIITVGGSTGAVAEISLFTTDLDTPDNKRIIVPNAVVWGATIVNLSHHGKIRAGVEVGTDYGADLGEVRKVLEAAAAKVEGRIESEPVSATIIALGGSSIDWEVRCYCAAEDYFGVIDQLRMLSKNALDAAGISIPFPQQDIHLDDAVVARLVS